MASPSRAGSLRPASSLGWPHAETVSAAASAAQTVALLRVRAIGSGILLGGLAGPRPCRVHPHRAAEARRLERLVARDRRPLERLVGPLLEDHPKPPEGGLVVP